MLAAPIAVPEMASVDDNLFDLFDDHPHACGKRPLKSEDPAMSRKRLRTNDEVTAL